MRLQSSLPLMGILLFACLSPTDGSDTFKSMSKKFTRSVKKASSSVKRTVQSTMKSLFTKKQSEWEKRYFQGHSEFDFGESASTSLARRHQSDLTRRRTSLPSYRPQQSPSHYLYPSNVSPPSLYRQPSPTGHYSEIEQHQQPASDSEIAYATTTQWPTTRVTSPQTAPFSFPHQLTGMPRTSAGTPRIYYFVPLISTLKRRNSEFVHL